MSESPTSEERQRFWRRAHRNDRIASWLLFWVILAFLVSLGAGVVHSFWNHVNVHRVEIKYVPCDSIFLANANTNFGNLLVSEEALDSIVSRLEIHEAQLNQKYQFILEKRDKEDNYRNIFMLVFGIAVSVAGFFGYRSFSNIEEKAIQFAETKSADVVNQVAPQKAQEKAKQVARQYCDDNVGRIVDSYMKTHLQELVNNRVDRLYSGEGRDSMVSEVIDNALKSVRKFIHSEEGKRFIRTEILNDLSDEVNKIMDDNITRIGLRLRDNQGAESVKESPMDSFNEADDGDSGQTSGDPQNGIPIF